MKEKFHRFSIYSSNGIMETKKEDNYMEAAELGKYRNNPQRKATHPG